ncbi:hypothetical protein Syun_021969 [Stephania yunnanensis]|uniref:FAD-binding PCMH-type domain-containing protein n=1 Tax=Stephania yunnanensis TaxID=152371 RepID=A0AAP0IIJ1_9MAGN
METSIAAILALLPILVYSISLAASGTAINDNFFRCLSTHSMHSLIPVYTPNNSSYSSILTSSIQNLLFLSSKTSKPSLVIAPLNESHVQAAVVCCRKHDLLIKIRSGGHDYEGLSYTSHHHVPFVLLDMVNMKSISINVEDRTAWVQAGASTGELYYRIAEKTSTLGFPGGLCLTVGVGGLITGGGYGYMLRKYGLAADNIVDAQIVNVKGEILNKESMGEDLFWAIRGGGGASFGVILSWKIKLVPVPSTVTIFAVSRTLDQGATELVHKWQYVAHKLPKEVYIRVPISKVDASQAGQKTIQAQFQCLFLGKTEQLLPLMEQSFPELGLKPEDCMEVSWFQTMLYFSGLPMNASLSTLLVNTFRLSMKGKSDYVREPISKSGLQGIWKIMLEANNLDIALTPYGGIMSEIPASTLPFPHREGNIYQIGYLTIWNEKGAKTAKNRISWLRKLYKYLKPFVSKSPRFAYLNYRDIDLGHHDFMNDTSSYAKAKVWGSSYFGNNFDRLVQVKSKVDPDNFFRNEQGIPPVK